MVKIIRQPKVRVPKKDQVPGVITNRESEFFYHQSITFENNRNAIKFAATTFKCKKCDFYSKHSMFSGYCYLQKRIVDANGVCPENTLEV